MNRTLAIIGMLAIVATPATAQKLGEGGIGVDETTEVPCCNRPLGTIALVEDRSAGSPTDGLPASLAALV